MPSKLSSPFLAFACVGKIDGNIDFVAGADGEGGGGSAVFVVRREPPRREGVPGKDDWKH